MQIRHATKLYCLPLLFSIISSCDRPACNNTNPTFDRFPVDSKPYKKELAVHINRLGTGNVRYWLDKYFEKDGKKYLTLFIQGDGLCAKGEMLVLDNTGIEQLVKMKGGGYSGAELRGLKLGIREDSADVVFTYEGLERILD